MDARIAALKAGLRLTSDQEKNWPAFESAVLDMAKARAERWAMRQTNSPPPTPSNGCSGVPTRSVKQRQVSKNSPMLKGHSIKVSMTRRNIALRFSRRDYDHCQHYRHDRADCGENERQELHWRFPQRGNIGPRFLTSGEPSEISAASAAVCRRCKRNSSGHGLK